MWASRHEDLWANVAFFGMHSNSDSSGCDGPIPSGAVDHDPTESHDWPFFRKEPCIHTYFYTLEAVIVATLVDTQNSASYAALVSS